MRERARIFFCNEYACTLPNLRAQLSRDKKAHQKYDDRLLKQRSFFALRSRGKLKSGSASIIAFNDRQHDSVLCMDEISRTHNMLLSCTS